MIMFLKSALSFTKLEYRALRFYPSNMVLAVIQGFVSAGMWFFVSLFLKDYAAASLAGYGGDFVSYMIIGVVFFQNAAAILNLPFQSINTAFWDKRLEVYNSSPFGIWAFIAGRFIWTFFCQLIIQAGVLTGAIIFTGVRINANIPIFPLLAFYFCFIFTNLGLGLLGAGNFFILEVKQGREPFTWLVETLARIFSGIYYPLAVLPAGLHFISRLIPHTYAMEGLRLVMLSGQGMENPIVRNNLTIMLVFATVSMLSGVFAFDKALEKAYRGNGVGMVI
jgi:ABC-2 type transport system permease protein